MIVFDEISIFKQPSQLANDCFIHILDEDDINSPFNKKLVVLKMENVEIEFDENAFDQACILFDCCIDDKARSYSLINDAFNQESTRISFSHHLASTDIADTLSLTDYSLISIRAKLSCKRYGVMRNLYNEFIVISPLLLNNEHNWKRSTTVISSSLCGMR